MKYLVILAIIFGLALTSSPAFGYTPSKFVSEYGQDLSEGQKIKVLVTVKGEPESQDPAKRAKEIRYLQSAVLKFCNFAGATNVKSESLNNEFTAIVTTSLAKILGERSDVVSVKVIGSAQNESYYEEYKPVNGQGVIFHDLSLLDFQILEVKKTFIPKWINEPGDYSDILQIKFNATNNGLNNFVIYKDMFKIDVVDPREKYGEFRQSNQKYVVDNYYPQYIEDFKLRFQDITLPTSLSECELLNHSLKKNQTKTLSICFDVKQKWTNQPLDLSGPRLYNIVMMDNKFTSSCPNCKVFLLNNYHDSEKDKGMQQNFLDWLGNLSKWTNAGLISEGEFFNAVNFLKNKGTINQNPNEIKKMFSEEKVKAKTNLTMVDFRHPRFNEAAPIVFEGKLTDSLGNPISNVPILIKSDGPCPSNHIISQGFTDKHGRYKIYTHTQLWGEKDGLVNTHAEFSGTYDLQSSVSDGQLVVVYPVKGEKCIG